MSPNVTEAGLKSLQMARPSLEINRIRGMTFSPSAPTYLSAFAVSRRTMLSESGLSLSVISVVQFSLQVVSRH